MTDPQALRARVDELFELHEQGELETALERYDELLAEGHEPQDPVTRESLFAARFDRAIILTVLGKLDDAVEAYTSAADMLDPDDPDVHHEIAMARVNRGIALGMLGHHRAAADAYEGVVDDFAGTRDPVVREQVVKARINLAAALLDGDRPDAALVAAHHAVATLDAASEIWELEQLGRALRLQAAILRHLGRDEEALAAYDEIERRCAHAEEPQVLEQVEAARSERAELGPDEP